ncbi:MAG: YicC family protein [Deltaproteobacteria bacterium]|nr:YicC family protein [Deltaproteobacteria bacterium]
MIRSMTGYGRGECARGDNTFVVEIRSVNNRYRDVVLRVPRTLQALEDDVRSQVASRIRRGRIEVAVQMERNGAETEYDLELNLPLVKSYFLLFQRLREDFELEGTVRPDTLLQMKDVILVKPREVDPEEARAGLREGLDLALDSHDGMRIQEGRAIEEDLNRRLRSIESRLDGIEQKAPGVVDEYRTRLKEKIDQVMETREVDEGRIAQEAALFADRCDITEEIVRTRSHIGQFRHYLASDEAVGRRLDFLMQEIYREVNTMSTKASDAQISSQAIEIKGELEKIREQVQNVE